MVHFAFPPLLKEILSKLIFPKTKSEILAFARAEGLPEDVLVALEAMPDHTYQSLDALIMAWSFRSEFQADAAPAPSIDPALAGATDEDHGMPTGKDDKGGGDDMLSPTAVAAP